MVRYQLKDISYMYIVDLIDSRFQNIFITQEITMFPVAIGILLKLIDAFVVM